MKNGYSLAEVLITIGVIGVVSAMTIPTVIKKYQERVTVNKVKKIYSIMSQAFMLSVKDNGYANDWNVDDKLSSTTANQIASYLTPYLKIIKECGTASGCIGYTQIVVRLNGTLHEGHNYDTDKNQYKFILSDGSFIWIRGSNGTYCKSTGNMDDLCGAIFFDINGNKQPNTIGKDIFQFIITPYAIKPNISDDCNPNGTGWGCAGYILQNNNMDYLK